MSGFHEFIAGNNNASVSILLEKILAFSLHDKQHTMLYLESGQNILVKKEYEHVKSLLKGAKG